MKEYRIIDLSLPIINGGGFARPAKMRYLDHRNRGGALAERLGIDPSEINYRANAMEEFSFLHTHAGTHFDAPYHSLETSQGKPTLTVDQIPLEWCFGPGIWLDLSHKKPGTDITAEDIERELKKIAYTISPEDIVLIKTGAADYYGRESC
ncbi:MAG: cyclase family protein, partial [Deltaproteobacteria bacterium]|nr:cyclase family protein [Deltaproteobacteria bacterium]